MEICKSCGGTLEREGSCYVCSYCGTKWPIITEDAMQVKLQNAWEALRRGDFDASAEMFEEIIVEQKDSYEAYWGRALAQNGIVFVTDLNENKRVPTCNNITENVFSALPDVQRAIELAPSELSDAYAALAEKIEGIRLEWLERASKEPPYDVFICYKESDREREIERTPDSYSAQELYAELVKEGYRVFFSRVSLRDKISEQYEPYIYNALKTARVMIVYGERAEYFHATWLKNEWNRFRLRLSRGEKHRNSLVVVYRDLDPAELPAALKTRQCMNAKDLTFYSDLLRHIQRVIRETEGSARVERVRIEGGQISMRASHLSVNSVKTKEIGVEDEVETGITEAQTLNLIDTYLQMREWGEAERLVEDLLFENPSSASAAWCRILLSVQAIGEADFARATAAVGRVETARLDALFRISTKEFATHILHLLFDSDLRSDALQAELLRCICAYSFEGREQKIEAAFQTVIARGYAQAFDVLLTTLGSDEVDRYISYHLQMVKSSEDPALLRECLRRVLAIEEGNTEALRLLVALDLETDTATEKTVEDFEMLLRYTDDMNREVIHTLGEITNATYGMRENVERFARQLLRYYGGELADFHSELMQLANYLLRTELRASAEYYYRLILTFDKTNADAYWGICLMRIGARSEREIPSCERSIRECPEFNKYLALVDESRRLYCIGLAKQQSAALEKAAQEARERRVDALRRQQYTCVSKIWDCQKRIEELIPEAARNQVCLKQVRRQLIAWGALAALFFLYTVAGGIVEGLRDASDAFYSLLAPLDLGVGIVRHVLLFATVILAGIFCLQKVAQGWSMLLLIIFFVTVPLWAWINLLLELNYRTKGVGGRAKAEMDELYQSHALLLQEKELIEREIAELQKSVHDGH